MSKSIEDYREIVKVLKLQLLKIRQQNNSLSKQLGVAPQTESSSFTPRVQKFKNSNTSIGKYLYLYNLFAHKCQLIGVSPQMVFRIADKKRDKEVSTNSMRQIMRRLKLKLNDDQISRLLDSITKSDKIFYEQYLQYLSAFQINSQIYPYKGQRTYPQKCLLKFGDEVKAKDNTATELCRNIIEKEGTPYISYQSFVKYCRSNKLKLKDVQIICAFVALDTQSQCQLSKDQFIRQMNKIYNLLEKGISYEDDVINQKPKKTQKNEEAQFDLTQQTGTQAGAKTKKKQTGKQVKANKNDLVQILEKQGISTNTLILKLLQKQEKRNLLRPFGLNDFCKVVQSLKSSITKKKVLQFFKNLDSSNNGSVSTDQLIKIWLEGKKVTDNPNTLLQLLARHFKQIQSKEYITRFNTLGYKNDDKINTQMLKNVLSGLDLEQNYIKLIQSNLSQNITVDQFVKTLEKGGVDNQQKEFKPLSKSEFQKMKAIVYKFINEKQKTNYQFKKLCRLQNQEDPQKQNEYWQTIFTDEWACWNYCLETAYKLDSFWRDHEFGPSKGDPHGYRSIVGNSSKIPSGLPDQQEITWLTFEKLLELQNNKKEEVKLFSDNLVANDILQGKIGNCWFVSALSIITSNDELIYGKPLQYCKRNPEGLTFGIHPVLFHYFRRFGIYVFKFFKNFKPVYVVVDNLFPVQVSNNQLAFAKSPNAGLQWVAFLQKAFAKLHHSYTNLISGQISQGLSDLTSCLPIKQSLVNNRSDELLQKMKTLSKQKQLMGCSINLPPNSKSQSPVLLDDEKTGLFYGHAYSLMDLIDLNQVSNKDFKLVRVRNPWGHGQWCLDWSDKPLNDEPEYEKLKQNLPIINKYYDEKIAKGKKMKENVKDIQKYETGQDGQFLMNFYDFAKIFTNLFTGYNIKDKQYKCYQFKGKWNKATPSGICKAKGASEAEKVQFVKNNYQFILEVKEETDIIIFLMQEDGRLYRGQQFPYKEICNGINILVFTLKNDQMLDKFETEKMTLPNLKFELKREVSFWHKFKQGRYAIVPCKIANKIPQTQIQIRLYADKPVQSLKKIKGAEGTNFTDLPESSKIYKQSVISQMIDLVGKLQSTK